MATGAAVEQAFDAWLNLLRQRSPRVHVVDQTSVRNVLTDSRNLPVAQIDLLTPVDGVSQEDQYGGIVIAPGTNGRYVVVAGYGAYAAAVATGLQSVMCRIRESSQSVEQESGWIDDVCLASAELCIELETEAFSEHRVGPSDSSQVPTSPAMQTAGRRSDPAAGQGGTENAGDTGKDKREYIFRQAANHLWEVAFAEERQIGVKSLAGMKLIRALLANAGRPIAASQLMADSAIATGFGLAIDKARVTDAIHQGALCESALSLSTPTLDNRAMRDIKARLIELGEKRKAAQEAGDHAEEARIDEETGALADRLRKDTGLGGRVRSIAPEIDRPRRAAFQRYRTALKHLRQHSPALADHLERCVRSGAKFVYQPDSEITWLT